MTDTKIIKSKYDLLFISKKIKKLEFSNVFDESVDGIIIPSHIETVKFGYWFDYPIDDIEWPTSLIHLEFVGCFDKSIDNIPDSIETLILNDNFNQVINKLPSSLKKLSIGKMYGKHLENIFPEGLEELYLYHSNIVNLNNLPNGLLVLHIKNLYKCEHGITNLPISLNTLVIDKKHEGLVGKLPFGCIIKYIDNVNTYYVDAEVQNIDLQEEISKIQKSLICKSVKEIKGVETDKLTKVEVVTIGEHLRIAQVANQVKIKGFIINWSKLYELNKLSFDVTIGGTTILRVPFKFMSLTNKHTESHLIDEDKAYLDFNQDFYLHDGFLLAPSWHSINFGIKDNTIEKQLGLQMVLEFTNLFQDDTPNFLEFKYPDQIRILRQIDSVESGKVNLNFASNGFFIEKNLDDIFNLEIQLDKVVKINYGTELLKIYGQKINNKLCYISLNGNKDYNIVDVTSLVPYSRYDYINININYGEITNLYSVNLNLLKNRDGMTGTMFSA